MFNLKNNYMKTQKIYLVLLLIVSLMAVSCTVEEDLSNIDEQAIDKKEIKDQDT